MAVFSCLRNISKDVFLAKRIPQLLLPIRKMSEHHTMPIQASKWQWHKFKDYFHLYFWIGMIPCAIIMTCANVFVGPATLAPIPEDYVPKHWEYYRHPISRWFARYAHTPPQQEYEKMLHYLWELKEKRDIRMIENIALNKMMDRGDYQGYYFVPYTSPAKARRILAETNEDLEKNYRGDTFNPH